MKFILVAVTALFSLSAMASCPDLSGTFSSSETNAQLQEFVISQKVLDGVTQYTLTSDGQPLVVRANGIAETFDANGVPIKVMGRCMDAETFHLSLSLKIEGDTPVKVLMNNYFSLNDDGDLQQKVKVTTISGEQSETQELEKVFNRI